MFYLNEIKLFGLNLIFVTFFSINLINASVNISCEIPNQNSLGHCIKKELCATYLETFNTRPLNAEKINFLKKVQCNLDHESDIFVCCPVTGIYSNPNIQFHTDSIKRKFRRPIIFDESTTEADDELNDRFSAFDEPGSNLLPGKDFCGLQIENRIIGGEITEIDEFPWMALLIYNSKDGNRFGCGGVLISKRYVLTAAHCVTGEQYLAKGGLKSVRFGEYNTETEVDCIQEGDVQDCADKPVDCGIEKIIPHPQYNYSDWNKYNDIALIRLNQIVNFTDFIRPICLPSESFDAGLEPGTFLSICGWGKTDLFRERRGYILSPIKLKLKIPIVDRQACSRAFMAQRLRISENQVCAGGEKSRDSCPGDSGSPLMFFDQKILRWVVSGIVSLGLNECGTDGVPGVYTNVQRYLSWIRENVRP